MTFAAPTLDQLPCACLVADPLGKIVWMNSILADWIGRPVDGSHPTTLAELLSPHSLQIYDSRRSAMSADDWRLNELQLDLQTQSGECLAVVGSASCRAGAAEPLVDWVFLPNVALRLYQRELDESRDEMRVLVHEATRLEAEAQDRAVFAEQMVGIVSHDLRNPLQAIQMGVLALTRGTLTTNQIRVLGRVSRSTERAHRLIADLLDFTAARVGSGLSITKQEIDLGDVLADAVEELRLAFPGRELRHLDSHAGACTADPDRLSQLVGNLVANAMAYGDPERPVTVMSSACADSVSIAVHNWGDPIPLDRIDKIFEPMVRGDTRGQSRSVGLGLFIVGEIVKAHSGNISVSSGLDSGTTFTVSLQAPGPG